MDVSKEKLLEVLSGHKTTFFIPPYQRNYEWDKTQCEIFFRDIISLYRQNKKIDNIDDNTANKHFIGTITCYEVAGSRFKSKECVLIDGQQRITTTMLFLAAVRDSISDEEVKDIINKEYLLNDTKDENTLFKVKLKQIETDASTYRKIITCQPIDEEDKATAVYTNYSYFRDRIKGLVNQNIDVFELIDLGLSYFTIVMIRLSPSAPGENPQEIFESMNSLGKPLSLADLVRNYVLLGLEPDIQNEYYKDYWLGIEKRLPGRISDFIRDYMQMCSGRSLPKATDKNHKKLYAEFKTLFSEKTDDEGHNVPFDVKILLENLDRYSRIYEYVIFDTSTGNKKIDRYLADFRSLRISVANSLFMVLLSEWKDGSFSDEDIIAIFGCCLTYWLRRRIIAEGQGENKVVPTLVKEVPDLIDAEDKQKKMFDILGSLQKSCRLPNDIEMAQKLRDMDFYNFEYNEFILALVEEELTKGRIDLSDKHLQLEHIMPQTLNPEWKSKLGPDAKEIHAKYVHRLGNITLIRHNQEVGNKPFSEKKLVYSENEGLQISKTMITNNTTWSIDAIEKRTEWLINELLNKVMPIPEDRKKVNNFSSEKASGRGRFSFDKLGLINETVKFIKDSSITAVVKNDKEVEYNGKLYKLSPLTEELMEQRGESIPSKAYDGPSYWTYGGKKLSLLMEMYQKDKYEEELLTFFPETEEDEE